MNAKRLSNLLARLRRRGLRDRLAEANVHTRSCAGVVHRHRITGEVGEVRCVFAWPGTVWGGATLVAVLDLSPHSHLRCSFADLRPATLEEAGAMMLASIMESRVNTNQSDRYYA